ncbi:hypothetical protein [Aliarcobacter thereius]|uniref:hypothetical protein n=1 Tax=Aliarcobacter thereius TaxID=544718 RepID=UPI00082466D9|nr:hypothetical protein [Aliarcobacter thereius]OCL90587.1 hypothetical protein AAX25_01685 [Aliarcobacter thereius]
MLKKVYYIKNYNNGLVVEYVLGKVSIGVSSKIDSKKLRYIIEEIEVILKELKKDGRFKDVRIDSHLLIKRKLIRNLSNREIRKNKVSFINEKYVELLLKQNYKYEQETRRITIFRKYLTFYSLKIYLIFKAILTFNYSTLKEDISFCVPNINYVGTLKISLQS